jgi:hypothetical protein
LFFSSSCFQVNNHLHFAVLLREVAKASCQRHAQAIPTNDQSSDIRSNKSQVAAHMFSICSGVDTSPTHCRSANSNVDHWNEHEIDQVAEDLFVDGRELWGRNPRLYIIMQAIGQIKQTSQPQLIDCLINSGFNDSWLPVASADSLPRNFPLNLQSSFLQAQSCVCVPPADFRIGHGSVHGHFATDMEPPFQSLRPIGNGSMGVVDEVLSLKDGQVYARKIFRKPSLFSRAQNDLQRFRSELRALGRIRSRHCVEIVREYVPFPILSL